MNNEFYTCTPDVAVDITNRCTLRCAHCYNESGEEPITDLPFGVLQDIFTQVSALGQHGINLSGGEPTLHPAILEIIEAARDLGLTVSLNTNGMIAHHVLAELRRLRLRRVSVSLDGMRAANDRIRGRGVFDSVIRVIPPLKAAADEVVIATHICSFNMQDVPALVELAADLGVGIRIAPLRPIGRARTLLADAIPSAREFRAVVEAVDCLRARLPTAYVKIDFDVLEHLSRAPAPPTPLRAVCPAGRARLNISCDGHVYPCSFFTTREREFSIGRIGETSIMELWQSAPVLRAFRALDGSSRCRRCGAFGIACVGGCLAMTYFCTGKLSGQDPACIVKDTELEGQHAF